MRATKTVTVSAAGRDKGKQFKLTEMSADAAERWALRALLVLANAGAKLPEGALDAGFAGFASTVPDLMVNGIRALGGMTYTPEVEQLLADMMVCVEYQPDGPGMPAQTLFRGDSCQIEEVRTRVFLRGEVLKLHMDPSLAGAFSS